ncbi:hypothetical protein ACFOPN_03675 [Xanthomonas hyacinthi]|uniref:hypothetical protein n=1 Tax=Xanthomonas hyacinthi TaxID=56455 RepID=UPI000A9AEF53
MATICCGHSGCIRVHPAQRNAQRWAIWRPCVPATHRHRHPYRFPPPFQRRAPQALFPFLPSTTRRHGRRRAGVLPMTGRAPAPAPHTASHP